MKMKLEQYVGKTLQLTGIFNEITYAKAAETYSVLIKPVFLNGHILCDHAWIAIPIDDNPLKCLELNKFDEVKFEATVEKYVKSGYIEEYGFKQMQNVYVVKRGQGNDYLSLMQKFTFKVKSEANVKIFGGKSKVVKQVMDKPLMNGVYLKENEKITCEFVKIHNNQLEFRLRTESMREGYWVKKVYFNPVRNGQSISVRGYFSIALPPKVYSNLKRAYFKIFCTKTSIVAA